MDDHSHLIGASHDSEKKTLINEGHHTHHPASGAELLEKMKHISALITDVRLFLSIEF
jgi:hypothetical protein